MRKLLEGAGTWLIRASGVLCLTVGLWAQADPLASRVLIIYNTNAAYVGDSQLVANYYKTKRSIPTSLCGIPFSSNTTIPLTEWVNTIQPAIRTCLDAAGRQNILYLVFSHQTPFRLESNSRWAALDSYAADVWGSYSTSFFWSVPSQAHGYFGGPQSQGNVYLAPLTLAQYRTQPRAQLIYSVWRLDGATPALVLAMIDKASATVLTPASGVAYLDRTYPDSMRFGPSDRGYTAGDWDLLRSAEVLRAGGFTVVEDIEQPEIGAGSTITSGPNAILYCGWYSLMTYNDVFTWRDGAIGWHLDSASGFDPRAGTNWVNNAIRRGITVTSGAVTEPFLDGMPQADGIFRQLMDGSNVGDAFLRNTQWLRWMMIFYGDPLYRPFPGGIAPFNGVLGESSLSLAPRFIVGGTATRGQITLASPAPGSGQVVTLSNSTQPSLTVLPATVTVPAGSRTAAFNIQTSAVTVATGTPLLITAQFGSTTLNNTLVLYPLLGGVSAPATLTGGSSTTGFVVLNGRASLAGQVVQLSSNHPAVQLPTTVTVPAGASAATFVISSSSVGAPVAAKITAQALGASVEANITVNP